MLSRVVSKLNSKRGASITLALLLLLICVFAGAAALTAASSNIGRYGAEGYIRKYQQQYLAVSSAAKLIRDELGDGLGSYKAEFTYNAGSGSITDKYFYNDNQYGRNVVIGEDDLIKLLWGSVTDYTYKYVKDNPPGGWNTDKMYTVTPQKKLVFEVTVRGEDNKDLNNMAVTVIVDLSAFPASKGVTGKIKVTVQSNDSDYALKFNMPVEFKCSENAAPLKVTLNCTEIPQIERAEKEVVS